MMSHNQVSTMQRFMSTINVLVMWKRLRGHHLAYTFSSLLHSTSHWWTSSLFNLIVIWDQVLSVQKLLTLKTLAMRQTSFLHWVTSRPSVSIWLIVLTQLPRWAMHLQLSVQRSCAITQRHLVNWQPAAQLQPLWACCLWRNVAASIATDVIWIIIAITFIQLRKSEHEFHSVI